MFGGILYLLKEIEVKNVVIGKQFEDSENYREFFKIVKAKNVNVFVVSESQKINIEKDLFLDILWPNKNQEIQENSINNNALVCKLNYKSFSMLFTGDIEDEAEKVLSSKYKDTNVLKADILKVRTSRLKDFFWYRVLELN